MNGRMPTLLRLTFALVLVAVVCPDRAAAGPIVLKMGWTTSDGATDPYAIAAREIAKALGEEAPGKFEVQFFPNRQLGDEKEMIEALSFGTMQMGVITNAPIGSVEPAFQVNDLPFLYSSEASAHAALDGALGQALLAKLEKRNIVGLGFAEGGFRQMINNVRPIQDPQNVEGIKWRVMQNPVYLGMFRSLGGNAVPLAWGETFTAVQQKTVDGLEIPLAVIQNNGYFEVTKFLSLTNHTYSALGVLMSKKTWDKLAPDQQQAVRRAVKKGIARQREANAANEAKTLATLREKGMLVNKINDPPAFRAKVVPVYDEFKAPIGADVYGEAMKAAR